MEVFETEATLDDARHLTLREPVPGDPGRDYRVIVLLDPVERNMPAAWPPGFFDEIRIDDPAFERPPQGELPPVAGLDE